MGSAAARPRCARSSSPHPDIFAFDEVFNLAGRDSNEPLLRESNFFTFLERYAKDDVRRTMPDYHEELFLDYLEYLRCLSQKRYTLIDVKYNMMHFLARPWQERGAPYLLELTVKHGLYALNVTRRNYLRSILSNEKAWSSNSYSVPDGDSAYFDGTRYLDPDYLFRELCQCRDEDRRIQQELTPHDRVPRATTRRSSPEAPSRPSSSSDSPTGEGSTTPS